MVRLGDAFSFHIVRFDCELPLSRLALIRCLHNTRKDRQTDMMINQLFRGGLHNYTSGIEIKKCRVVDCHCFHNITVFTMTRWHVHHVVKMTDSLFEGYEDKLFSNHLLISAVLHVSLQCSSLPNNKRLFQFRRSQFDAAITAECRGSPRKEK